MTATAAQPLRRRVTDMATRARDKVKSLREVAALSKQAQEQGRSVVLAHGVFDLVHLGHIRHLEAADKEGDILIASVTPDRWGLGDPLKRIGL